MKSASQNFDGQIVFGQVFAERKSRTLLRRFGTFSFVSPLVLFQKILLDLVRAISEAVRNCSKENFLTV